MERVAFLVEDTKERLGCMLNPETLEIRRTAGLQARTIGAPGAVPRRDDALIATGGGSTELRLDLLFDVHLAGTAPGVEDVRLLTGPLWRLAENREDGRIGLVRFIWGKHWNLPGVIATVAERLDRFGPGGIPQRSWLRMRMLRVDRADSPPAATPPPAALPRDRLSAEGAMPPPAGPVHTVLGSGDGRLGERLDAIAARNYGDPGGWRAIAAANGLDDPFHLPAGLRLIVPRSGGGAA